jgi:hypothetical protein
VRKAIYAITLVLLGALIIQSVWGAEAKPVRLPHAACAQIATQLS